MSRPCASVCARDASTRHIDVIRARILLFALAAAWVLLGSGRAAGNPNAAGHTETTFDPSVHGFQFVNFFDGQIFVDLPNVSIPGHVISLGRIDLGATTYGLCGGMTYAAADTFCLKGRAPGDTHAPASGAELRSYIYNRQRTSLEADNFHTVRQLIDWIRRPDDTNATGTGVNVLADREFRRTITVELNAGRPVPLCLVEASFNDLISSPANAFKKNHQVLAIGYHEHIRPGARNEWDIDVYDPNYPNERQTLHTIQHLETQASSGQVTGHFRGEFVTPYSVVRPYWVPLTPSNDRLIHKLNSEIHQPSLSTRDE